VNQAQYSTAEQMSELKTLIVKQGFNLSNVTENDVLKFIQIANQNGLYDAADLIHNRVFTTGGESWLSASLLDW
jgi:hypothetical protein